MIGPRHVGSPPTLKRQLSRLSSSSSFQVRQSNSRIYTFLIAGGVLLLATVALLQFHLQWAPQGSKLSPLEKAKSDEGIVPAQQSWWGENEGDLDLAPGKERAAEKIKLGRKMGSVQVVKDGEEEESSEEDTDVGDGMEDDEDEESDQQALFDIDVDDRMLEEEAEAEDEDPNLEILAEMSNDEDSTEDSAEDSAENLTKSGQRSVADDSVSGGERVDSIVLGLANILTDLKDDKMVKANSVPDWVLDIKSGSQQEGIVDTLHGFERDLVKGLEKKKGSFFWDHAVGMGKRSLENVEPVSVEETNAPVSESAGGYVDAKDAGDGVAAKVAMQHLQGFKDFVENWKERFNSDDELVDDNVQQRLELVREIEDALLLNGDGGAAEKASSSKRFGVLLKKGSFDRMNPSSNPMLQDPDTPPGTWMTKTDQEMLRAIRGDRSNVAQQQPKALLRGTVLDVVTVKDPAVRRQASIR